MKQMLATYRPECHITVHHNVTKSTNKIKKFKTKLLLFFLLCLPYLYLFLSGVYRKTFNVEKFDEDSKIGTRKLLWLFQDIAITSTTNGSLVDDFPSITFPFGTFGSILFPTVITIYMFVFLAILCDDYFVPCIQIFCKKLDLSEDVAAATFMAVGINAPELFTNLISTFYTTSDVGTGTVVGSGVFNVLAIPSLCIIFSKTEKIQLYGFPLTRDSFFYMASVTVLAIILRDGKVMWYESLSMIILYAFYIIVMKYNRELIDFTERYITKKVNRINNVQPDLSVLNPLLQRKSAMAGSEITEENPFKTHYFPEIPMENSGGCLSGFQDFFMCPANKILKFTIPTNRHNICLTLTFIMCALWMALISYVMTWMITLLGLVLEIPNSIMGMTFIAAGLSVPETVSSIIVAKQGFGSMALGNTLGSSIFGILMCMGVPWFIDSIFVNPNHFTLISSVGLDHSLILLIISIIIMYLLFCLNKFRLDLLIALSCLVLYTLFIAMFIFTEIKL